MTILQTEQVKGNKTVATPDTVGVVLSQKYDYVLTANVVAASDILEAGILPAGCTVEDMILITDELGTVTLDVGLMSGTVGDTGSRTSGAEFFDDAADASVVRMSLAGGFRIAPTDADRSIGIKFSANITAASQKVQLIVRYKSGGI